MSGYFFLSSILPPLRFGNEPEMAFDEVCTLYHQNLKASDWQKVCTLRKTIDLKNVQALLRKQKIDPRGLLSEKELDEAIINQEWLTEPLYDLLNGSDSRNDQLRHFSKVILAYYSEEEKRQKGFLSWYFRFQKEWKILLTAYRAKKLGRDLLPEIQHADFQDPIVAEILAQKEAQAFEFPYEYEALKEVIKAAQGDPQKEYEAMASYQLDRLREEVEDRPFSLDYLLSYLLQLQIVEEGIELDEQLGKEKLREIVKGTT